MEINKWYFHLHRKRIRTYGVAAYKSTRLKNEENVSLASFLQKQLRKLKRPAPILEIWNHLNFLKCPLQKKKWKTFVLNLHITIV